MKKYAPVILPLILIKLVIQLIGNTNYGFHRDELLHLSASEHLDWGYFEFPPFIAFIGFLSNIFFDHSLWGVRLFPALAGCLILLLTCKIVIEMGGQKKAVFLAGLSILAFVPFFRNHTLFQPVAFDQFFWIAGFYLLLRYQNTDNTRFLLWLGVVAGLGLMTKYTMLIWGFGVAIGLFFFQNERIYKNKWLYISGCIALLIFLPNIIWQIANDLPLIDHMKELNESQLSETSSFDFVLGIIEIPPAVLLSLTAVFAILFNHKLKQYSYLGISILTIFLVMWSLKAKPYYFFAAFPMIFAFSSIQLEQWFENRSIIFYGISASLMLPMIYFIPLMTPVLPIQTFTDWYEIEKVGTHYELSGDYADMFGWEEQVAIVDSLYQSFPENSRDEIVIWAENYGEAGALTILGDQYGLPNPISRHGSFWKWGYQNPNASYWISIGNETASVEYIFHECTLIRRIDHPYAIEEERGIPLYVCSNPKQPIENWWAAYRPYIFD